ncbi:MAG: hypothetical protein ACI9IJ_000695, partial [Psychromonas sp.]
CIGERSAASFLSIQRASLLNETGINYLTVIFIERQKNERS